MRTFILALLLLPATVFAQYENNPQQQNLWEAMTNVAPAYEMLLACDRDYTANLVWEDLAAFAATMVQNERDVLITHEMWREARSNAQITYWNAIRSMRQNPQGSVCDDLENDVIGILGEGV